MAEQTYKLFDMGILAQINIGAWSCRKMLTRADLEKMGLDASVIPDICNLGRKLLVPKEEHNVFAKIEGQARNILAKFSVPFPIGHAYYVPYKKLAEIQERITYLQEQYTKATDSFVARFADMKEAMRQQYPEFWQNCLAKSYPPTAEKLREKFHFRFFTFKVAGFDTAALQECSVEDAMAQGKVVDEKTRLIREQMQQEIGGFVEEYVMTMRKQTADFCDLVTARLHNKPYGEETEAKKFTTKSITAFRKYIDKFIDMNIFNDNEVSKMLTDLKTEFFLGNSSAKDFQGESVKNALTKALAAIRAKAAEEGDQVNAMINQLQRKVVL